MVEFVLILPVFILLVLGIVQLSMIFINKMMLQYSAYMLARVAVAYPTYTLERYTQVPKADSILEGMMTAANNPSGSMLTTLSGMSADSLQGFFLGKFKGANVSWRWDNSIKSSAGRFIAVSVTYDMPLKVPFVNKIFGLFQKSSSNSGDILAAESGFPVYTINACSVMRYHPGFWGL